MEKDVPPSSLGPCKNVQLQANLWEEKEEERIFSFTLPFFLWNIFIWKGNSLGRRSYYPTTPPSKLKKAGQLCGSGLDDVKHMPSSESDSPLLATNVKVLYEYVCV